VNRLSLICVLMVGEPSICKAESVLELVQGDWIQIESQLSECQEYPMRIFVDNNGSELGFFFPTAAEGYTNVQSDAVRGSILEASGSKIKVRAYDLAVVYHYSVSSERLVVEVGAPDGSGTLTSAGTFRRCSGDETTS
jgi:hypothetical protein